MNILKKGHVYTTLVVFSQWRTGDFVIVDNRAVAHAPSSAAHRPEKDIGLRLLRRMVVGGRTEPMTAHSRDNPTQRAKPGQPWLLW